ncbi:ABC transporter permease [Amycolatopsis rhabdoformis]|uniref:ABC transporter permease n=1 Tax=Amycolatopsis rhabdoformis TaxID=1448059 RepID=A0ABZ1IJD9_9PSEU|nr:ABC transporter permease [Amycolatopsis rhabdoformis]WSE33535.1 ABC transporter permease [Amycolatopsis rhabdoformis]
MTTDLNPAVAPPQEPLKTRRRPALAAVAARASLVLVLIVLTAVFTAVNGSGFFSADTLLLVLSSQAAVGVIALAVTLASVVGQIDLSVAGVMGGAAGIAALLVSGGAGALTAIACALGFSLVFGVINGVLVTYARLSSIIATLATGTLATGAGLAIVGPNTITATSPAFLNLFSSSVAGVQTAFFLFLVLTVVAMVVLQRTLLGRRLFFRGQNEAAAALLGIKVRRLTIGSMIAAAVLAGFAGVMLAGQNGGASVTQTGGYLLPAFAAAFLGTSAIVPGRFNAGGTFIATYVLGEATVGLNMAGVPQWSSYLFNGGLLIVSLGAFAIITARRDRAAKRASARAVVTTAGNADD